MFFSAVYFVFFGIYYLKSIVFFNKTYNTNIMTFYFLRNKKVKFEALFFICVLFCAFRAPHSLNPPLVKSGRQLESFQLTM